MRFIFLILLFVLGCAAAERRQAKLEESISQKWHGRTLADLTAHSYLKTLKHTSREGQHSFIKEAQFNSKARCQALGGCTTFFEEGCEHIFHTKDNRVTNYQARGDCFAEMEWLLKSSP